MGSKRARFRASQSGKFQRNQFRVHDDCSRSRYSGNALSILVKIVRIFLKLIFLIIGLKGISEPVRFIIETRAKVFGHNERFWYYSQKQMTLQFAVHVTEVRDPPPNSSSYDLTYRVVEICNEGEIERPSKGLVSKLYIQMLSSLRCYCFVINREWAWRFR